MSTALAAALEQPADEEHLYEMVDGRWVPKPRLDASTMYLATRLGCHLACHDGLERAGTAVMHMLFVLDAAGKLRRRPEAAFVSEARWPKSKPLPADDDWRVIPDLAVDFVGRNHTTASVRERLGEYFQAGVQLVWVIYPRWQEVHVYTALTQCRILPRTEELDGGTVVPGFRLPLATLFHPGPAPE